MRFVVGFWGGWGAGGGGGGKLGGEEKDKGSPKKVVPQAYKKSFRRLAT